MSTESPCFKHILNQTLGGNNLTLKISFKDFIYQFILGLLSLNLKSSKTLIFFFLALKE